MANAWLLRPLPNVGAVTTIGSVVAGVGANVFNDFAGIVCELACDASNQAVIRFDLGADTAIDTLMLFGLDRLPGAATMVVAYATAAQGNFTGASTAEAAVPAYAGTVMPAAGRCCGLWSRTTPATGRYWQVTFAPGSAGQFVRVARIVIGRRIVLERNFSFGAAFGVRDLGAVDFNARGILQRRRGKKLRTIGLTFSSIRKDEVEALTKPLLELVGNTEVVAVLTDPEAHEQRQNRAYCGPLVGDLSHVWRNAVAHEAKVNVVSLF